TEVRTSESHPLEVFWVEASAHANQGKLGLTFAPGKRGDGLVTRARWERSLYADLDRLKDHHGADLLVSLMEEFEYDMLGIPTLFAEARQRGIRVHHLPIVDTSVRAAAQAAEVDELVGAIRQALSAGDRVVVHSRGGQRRTVTMPSIVRTTFGRDPQKASPIARPGQPRAAESARPQQYVREASPRLAADAATVRANAREASSTQRMAPSRRKYEP